MILLLVSSTLESGFNTLSSMELELTSSRMIGLPKIGSPTGKGFSEIKSRLSSEQLENKKIQKIIRQIKGFCII